MTVRVKSAILYNRKGGEELARPKKNTEDFKVSLPPEVAEEIRKEMEKRGSNASAIIREVMLEWYRKRTEK